MNPYNIKISSFFIVYIWIKILLRETFFVIEIFVIINIMIIIMKVIIIMRKAKLYWKELSDFW